MRGPVDRVVCAEASAESLAAKRRRGAMVTEGFPLGKLVVEQGPWACGNIGATGKR